MLERYPLEMLWDISGFCKHEEKNFEALFFCAEILSDYIPLYPLHKSEVDKIAIFT